MYLTNRHLSRRTVLKGMGVTMALPLLEAMLPARRALAATAAGKKVRLVAIEMVHGSAGSTALGIKKNLWAPSAVGRDFDLSSTSLVSLQPYRDYVTSSATPTCGTRRRSRRRRSAATTSGRAPCSSPR